MRAYLFFKVKNEKLPSGRQVEMFRWNLAGIFMLIIFTLIGHYLIALTLFLILSKLGPVYEFYTAWLIEDPKYFVLFVKSIQQFSIKQKLSLTKLEKKEHKERTQLL